MTLLDHIVLTIYFCTVVLIGTRFSAGQKTLQEFFLGNRNIPWWAASLSGVATVLSAVAYLGAPGQAYKADLTYLQYRLALPFAILLVCGLMIPYFYRMQVFTVYEYLERRFDLKTRLLGSAIFLVLKCCYMGVVIYAPSVFVAQITGFSLPFVIVVTGVLTALYTTLGGMRAVIWTDTFQLFVLLGGLAAAALVIGIRLDGGWSEVFAVAGERQKLRFFDFSPSLTTEFTFLGGLIGGIFLMVSEYGTDQASVQRFLTTSSMRRGQWAVGSSMVISSCLGALLFLVGTGLYVYYLEFADKGGIGLAPDRVFPKFIAEELPTGFRGLLVASVLAAAMSTISGVLNSLTTVVMVDFGQTLLRRTSSVASARRVTFGLGICCTLFALFADRLGNLIVASAKLTSFFGGSLVGIFLLGMTARHVGGNAAFFGLLVGSAAVAVLSASTAVSWMWYGAFSALTAYIAGLLFHLIAPQNTVKSVEQREIVRG